MKIVGLMLIAATFLFALQGEAVFEKNALPATVNTTFPKAN